MVAKSLNKEIKTIGKDVMNYKKPTSKNMYVGVISLGCDKNRVDTELMLTYLRDAGYKFTTDASKADIIIVNTCGFIKSARDESMEAINEMSAFRKDPNSKCSRLIVTGCMPQKWSTEMREEFPEVDIILGIDQYPDIVKIIESSFQKNKKIIRVGGMNTIPYVKDRMITTPAHFAYLKIADGCDNFCTFCTIPQIRGRYRSRSMEDLLDEAKDLVKHGAKEIILVAQDVTKYGIDKSGKSQLVKLIKNLSKIEKLKWIRLLYCYPENIDDELLNELINNSKLCKYIDIPFQHVSDKVLKRMNRRTTKKDIIELVERIQTLPTYIAIRSTFMVGFPGETEEDFKELYNFISKYDMLHVGFFAYSKEPDTPAGRMLDQVEESVKEKRVLKLFRLQKKVIRRVNNYFVGKVLDVVFEGVDYKKQMFFGRSQYQAPEVDTLVFFKSKIKLEVGQIYKVKINKVIGYDLKGEVVNE